MQDDDITNAEAREASRPAAMKARGGSQVNAVTGSQASRTAARGSQFLDYAFYVLYTLLGIRLVLALIAAQSGNGFVRFISTITNPFYAPFKGIVSSPTTEAGNTLVFPLIIAIVVYALVHLGINGMLRMVGSRKTVI